MKSKLPKTEFSGGRDDFNLAVGVGAMIKLPSGVYRHAVSTIGKDVSLIDLAKRAEAGAYGVYYKKHMQRVFLRRGIGGDDVLRGNEDLI